MYISGATLSEVTVTEAVVGAPGLLTVTVYRPVVIAVILAVLAPVFQ
jgi:hypothetical protein